MTETVTSAVNRSAAGSGRLPRFEGARAVAAYLVLLTHTGFISDAINAGVPGRFLARGDWGVALFFALSGFLLSRAWVRWIQHEGKRPSLKRYALHRTARILPAYYVALAAILLTVGAGADTRTIVSNVLLVQNYTGTFLPDFFITWSLVTEVAFYAVLPLLAVVLIRRSVRTTALLLVGLAASAYVYLFLVQGPLADRAPMFATVWLPAHLDWFAMGMLIAVFEHRIRSGEPILPTLTNRPSVLMASAVTLYAVAMTPLAGPLSIGGNITTVNVLAKEFLYASMALLVLWALLAPAASNTWWGRLLDTPVMRWAGRLSYAFFLWHSLVLTFVRKLLGIPDFGGGFVVSLVGTTMVTLVICQLSWWLVERPPLKWVGASTT
jgi:peptidoglycan/LPS O-acetylase OafA/YrhL